MACRSRTLAQALADIERALALAPAHISHYQLTLEPGTVFAGRPPPACPTRDLRADMQLACQQRLAEARLRAVRGVGLCARRRSAAATISTTGSSATISASARALTARSRRFERRSSHRAQPAAQREPRRYLGELWTAAPAAAHRCPAAGAAVRVPDECAAAERRLRGALSSRRAPAFGVSELVALARGSCAAARAAGTSRGRAGARARWASIFSTICWREFLPPAALIDRANFPDGRCLGASARRLYAQRGSGRCTQISRLRHILFTQRDDSDITD